MRPTRLVPAFIVALVSCARHAPPAAEPPLPAPIPPLSAAPQVQYAMRYVDVAPGTGAVAEARKCIYAHYTGWLTNGTKFDSSHDTTDAGQPREPIAFPQGARRVIPGWDAGFEGMRVGGRRRFVIPYQLAYGELGRPPRIPPKSTLIFDVELMAVADTLPRPADAPTPRTPADAAPQCPTWAAVSGGPPASPTAPAPTSVLESIVRARLDAVDAHTTFYAKQLSTGREVAVRADEPMNTASVIKLPVLVLAFRDADAGRLKLDERYTIRPEDLRRGSGLLQTFAVGLRPTLHDLLTQMVVTSDNTATDIMIARVGGVARVNRMLDSLGFRDTRLNMTVGQAFRAVWEAADPKYASLSDRAVFERGFPDDSGAARRTTAFVLDSTKWLGRTTAREIARFLERLERGELASAKSTDAMRRILQEQLYSSRIPQRIQFRVSVGHKTGDWPPLLGNDVGIMYAPSGPIVIAVFANGNRGPFHELEAAEGRVAEDVLDAWEK